jgi:mannonate dehydratase
MSGCLTTVRAAMLLGALADFRNIRGGLHDFEEVWPDEGDVDMHDLCATLFDAGYDHMLDPDHAPGHPDDPGAQSSAH